MHLIKPSHFLTSLVVLCALCPFALRSHASQEKEQTPAPDQPTSASAMVGVTPQRTRVYDSPPILQPKSLIWKTTKLFLSDRSYPTIVTLQGVPGNPSTAVSTPSGHAFSELLWANGTIYFSLYINDGYVFAQDSVTGKDKWRFKIKGVRLSPVAAAYGMVYVGASDGAFYAIDAATGQQAWKRPQKGRGFFTHAPIIAEGVVYFSSTESPFEYNVRPDGRIFAFDAKTGDQLWVFKTKGATSSIAYDSKRLFVGDNDGYLRALDALTGAERWKIKISGGGLNPIIKEEIVYFRTKDGGLHAVEAGSGKERWKTEESKAATLLALYDRSIYYGGESGNIYALDTATGQQKWVYKTPKLCQSPVVAGGIIYFSSHDGVIYALDTSTGEERWKLNELHAVLSPPVIAAGMLYFLDGSGHLYALK